MKEHRGRWIYRCAVEDCHETFKDLRARLQHIKSHQLEPITSIHEVMPNPVERSDCIFCGNWIGAGKLKLARHLGRHMEEISFAVVTKTYEDWESYEDSSHADSLNSQPVIDTQYNETKKDREKATVIAWKHKRAHRPSCCLNRSLSIVTILHPINLLYFPIRPNDQPQLSASRVCAAKYTLS